jgi:hypothetical protein
MTLTWGEPVVELSDVTIAVLLQPPHPARQAYSKRPVESFHGRLREECLRANWLSNLFDACSKITAWIKECNEVTVLRQL